jgi:hypothetical protein
MGETKLHSFRFTPMYLGTTPRENSSLGNIYIFYLNLCVAELRNIR